VTDRIATIGEFTVGVAGVGLLIVTAVSWGDLGWSARLFAVTFAALGVEEFVAYGRRRRRLRAKAGIE
jgi:hypothetical protein